MRVCHEKEVIEMAGNLIHTPLILLLGPEVLLQLKIPILAPTMPNINPYNTESEHPRLCPTSFPVKINK